jgi:hypothetical protein
MASPEYISLETRKPLMKLPIRGFDTLRIAGTTEANVTLPIPAPKRPLKTSDLHIFLVRRGYISDDANTAERHDAI